MSRFVEKTARTQEEALEAALVELDASITDVDVQVLEEGSKGLFGLFGSRPYRIRVTLREDRGGEDELDVASLLGERKPAPKPRAPKPEKKPAPAPVEEKKPETPAEPAAPQAQPEERKAGRRPEPVRRVNPERKPAEETPVEKPVAPETAEAAPADVPEIEEQQEADGEVVAVQHKRRRHRSRGGAKKRKAAENAEAPVEEAEKPALPPKAPAKPMEKPEVTMIPAGELDDASQAGRAKAFLLELTQLMGVQVTVEMGTDAEGNVYGYMNGDTSGILIGRRGETLDALQYLTSLRVNRGQEHYTRVTLDTENYRAKREDTLTRLANRKANHAMKTGRKVALDPMNPYERRIIHSALQANEGVETHSEGEEPNRHVVITVRKA